MSRIRYDDDCERLTTQEAKAWAEEYLKGFYGRDTDEDYSWVLAVNPKTTMPVLMRLNDYDALVSSGEWAKGVMKRTYKAGTGTYGTAAAAADQTTDRIPMRPSSEMKAAANVTNMRALLLDGLKKSLDAEGYETLIKKAIAISVRS